MKWPALPRATSAEMLFSAKSFGAAMLAMYLASSAGLPRPFWALLTSYVVAAPLAGNVRSKALFRFFGTLIGCTATVFMVPALANTPELLTLALALWVGLCLYLSLLDRTARSYVFMLAGYTAALIGFPSVQTPNALFDNAIARVEEIGLGILCATLVHSLVLPVGMGPTLLGLMDRSLGDARHWFADVLRPLRRWRDGTGETGVAAAAHDPLPADRQRLAGDITQLRLLSTHVPFDTSHLRWTTDAIDLMQDRLAALTPALSAVEDRLQALFEAEGDLAPDVTAVLAATATWLQEDANASIGSALSDSATDRLRESLSLLGEPRLPATPGRPQATGTPEAPQTPETPQTRETPERIAPEATNAPSDAGMAWREALRIGLAVRLDELVQGWHACQTLRQRIDVGLRGSPPPLGRSAAVGNRVLHNDTGLALLSAFAAVLAICLCSLFWIATAWPSGSAAAMMAAVFCSFFATMDDPVPGIVTFLKFTLWSTPISAVYVLVLLPLVHDFGMLALTCAPVFVVLGICAGRPATALPGMAMIFGVAGTLSMHDTGVVDLPNFFNSTLAQVLGIATAAQVTRIVRTVGAQWSAQRIRRATWKELGDIAAAARAAPADDSYAVRMVDRIGLLAPRVVNADPVVRNDTVEGALRDLRAGVDIVALRRVRSLLPAAGLGEVMRGLATLFRDRGAGRGGAPSAALLAHIDGVLVALLAPPGGGEPATANASPGSTRRLELRSAVAALVGLRRNLFPAASPALTALEPEPSA